MPHQTPTDRRGFSRRGFLKAAGAGAAAAALPSIVPSSVFGAGAPSNRIHVACIGTGNQGSGILRRFMENDDVEIVAVCDVNTASYGYRDESQYLGREPARKTVDEYYGKRAGNSTYKACRTHIDFREVLASGDVDAVTVVVPDQWHAIMTIRAAEAARTSIAKPLSLTIAQGRAMVENPGTGASCRPAWSTAAG